jgi:hypothetical protein
MHSLSVVISVEINRRHYFWSDLRIISLLHLMDLGTHSCMNVAQDVLKNKTCTYL